MIVQRSASVTVLLSFCDLEKAIHTKPVAPLQSHTRMCTTTIPSAFSAFHRIVAISISIPSFQTKQSPPQLSKEKQTGVLIARLVKLVKVAGGT
ncbi:hypothetical protein AN958_02870 [Leucoagaricus sp. SymC.cos]|nr:hypothetical protein AN958_02870 [Leucoagaricus sp. SymC.cos]